MSKLKIIPNPNKLKYEEVTEAVKSNNDYCPCSIIKDDSTKCICKEFREQEYEGLCHCERYVKIIK